MEKLQSNINFFLFFAGDCDFERPLSACGYSQGRDDDLDWEQANTREKPSSDSWMPSGKSVGTGSIRTMKHHHRHTRSERAHTVISGALIKR